MFLETLLGARERLVLSVRRARRADRRSAGAVVGDPRARRHPAPRATCRRRRRAACSMTRRRSRCAGSTTRIAWRRTRRRCARAARARSAARWRRRCPPAPPPPELSSLQRAAAARDLPSAGDVAGAAPTAQGAPTGRRTPRRDAAHHARSISLQTLRLFLEDPLQGAARFRLRMQRDRRRRGAHRPRRRAVRERAHRSARCGCARRCCRCWRARPARGPSPSIGPPGPRCARPTRDSRGATSCWGAPDRSLPRRRAPGRGRDPGHLVGAGARRRRRLAPRGAHRALRARRRARGRRRSARSDRALGARSRARRRGALEIVGRTELIVAPARATHPPARWSSRAARPEATPAPTASSCAPSSIMSRSRRPACPRARTRRCWRWPTARPGGRAAERARAAAVRAARTGARAGLPGDAGVRAAGGRPRSGHRAPDRACTPICCRTRRSSGGHRKKGTSSRRSRDLRERSARPRNRPFSSGYGPVPLAIERHLPPSPEAAARMVARAASACSSTLLRERGRRRTSA